MPEIAVVRVPDVADLEMTVGDKAKMFPDQARQIVDGPVGSGGECLQRAGLSPIEFSLLVKEPIAAVPVGQEVKEALHILRRLLCRDAAARLGPRFHEKIRKWQLGVVPGIAQSLHRFTHILFQQRVESRPDPSGGRR